LFLFALTRINERYIRRQNPRISRNLLSSNLRKSA
jgi:hypothetical protein